MNEVSRSVATGASSAETAAGAGAQPSEPGTGFPNWAAVFPATRALVPPSEDPEFTTTTPSVVRGLFIDLAALALLLPLRRDPCGPLDIHADVLRIGAPIALALATLRIHARRIEVSAGASLRIDKPAVDANPACGFELDFGELAMQTPTAALHVDFLGVEQVLVADDAPGRIRLVCTGDASAGTVVTGAVSAVITPGDPLQAELQLLTARTLSHLPDRSAPERAGVALQMAKWVNHGHAQPGGDLALAASSRILTERLLGARSQLSFVPHLRWGEYFQLAQHTATALLAVERQAERFFDRSQDIDERKAAARAMLQHYENERSLSHKLLDQAAQEMGDAEQVSKACAAKLEKQQQEVTTAQTKFEAGVKKKEEEQRTETILAIIGAVVAVGVGVIAACTGNPSGLSSVAGAAKAGGQVAEQVSKLKQILQKIWKAMQAIATLVKTVSALKAAADLVKKHVQTDAQLRDLKSLQSKVTADETLTTADWDVFSVEMRSLFRTPIEIGIDGAEDYLAALEKLAIRGKDTIDTGSRYERCVQAYHQRLWESERDRQDIEVVNRELDRLCKDQPPSLRMMMFYERLHNQLKLRLIQAIENVGDALRYYALREPTYAPSITSTAAELQTMLSDAQSDLVGAKEAFRSPPATWGPKVYRVWARAALDQLQRERSLSWTISLHNFPGFDRIRISEIRVWLIGPSLGMRKVHIKIATSGTYRDRLEGRSFEFASEPLQRTFEYQPMKSGNARNHRGESVRITARADDREHSYFQPSPFTTWEITVPQSLNPGLHLEGVTEVGLEFHGTYIGGGPLVGAPDAAGPQAGLETTIL